MYRLKINYADRSISKDDDKILFCSLELNGEINDLDLVVCFSDVYSNPSNAEEEEYVEDVMIAIRFFSPQRYVILAFIFVWT